MRAKHIWMTAALMTGCMIMVGATAPMAMAQQAATAAAGTASGHITEEDLTVNFSHAAALGLDNAEGDDDAKMRLVLTEQPVAPEALMGGAFPPVWYLAKSGKVRGVMIDFDPADRTSASVVVLAEPDEPGMSLTTVSLSDSEGLWKALSVTGGRISGHMVRDGFSGIDLTFDTPISTNKVVSDLKGPAAQASELVGILKARTKAIVAGDQATIRQLSTQESFERGQEQEMEPDQIKAFAAMIVPLYDKVKRVVIREHTATVMLPEGFSASFVKEDGVWKCAD